MSNSGATPERSDISETATSDPCIRFVQETNDAGELVHVKKRMGRHACIWEDLLVMKVCATCGDRKPFVRFEGQ